MSANLITVARFPLLAIVVLTLYFGSPMTQIAGVGVLLLGLALDTVDGVVARRRKETSLVGSVLDIAADRTYELVLWVCFADLGLIPLAIPLLVVARTALTDAFRAVGVGQGVTPFSQLGTRVGRFLVASSWMRIGYGASKLLAFSGLMLARALDGARVAETMIGDVALTVAWICVALCLLRGLPVVAEGLRGLAVRSDSGANVAG
jgi:phosphatidylglycerophosphate synthase